MMCGRVEILDWGLLSTMAELAFGRILPAQILPGPQEDPRALAECLSHLHSLRQTVAGDDTRVSLEWLLTRFHPFQSSDPRDKIYSLLGLVNQADKEGIPVDYEGPVEELYVKAASRILTSSQHLTLLYHNLEVKNLDLPSWVPDWSTWVYGSLGVAYEQIYSACGKTTPRVEVDDSKHTLRLTGCLVSQITETSSPIGHHYRRFDTESILPRKTWLAEQENFIGRLAPYPDGSELIDVLWRTLIADLTFYKQRARSNYRKLYFAHRDYTEESSAHIKEMAREFVDSVRRKSRSRRLARTVTGHLGAVPNATEAGDWVCMFHGAKQLFVIRKVGDCAYKLIGSAFVHGFMYGEILKADWYREESILLV